MSEKLNARELAFHYLASQHEKLSEEAYLAKLIESEARFTELLASEAQDPLSIWDTLGRQS